jgi:ferric iron reductase protein FhuF
MPEHYFEMWYLLSSFGEATHELSWHGVFWYISVIVDRLDTLVNDQVANIIQSIVMLLVSL